MNQSTPATGEVGNSTLGFAPLPEAAPRGLFEYQSERSKKPAGGAGASGSVPKGSRPIGDE